ncbi:hypothetical protein OG21DRAFT_962017 [Imleria badia]|nr:hypothetical protein OG21DRAFT_962017 [Imleria badia]
MARPNDRAPSSASKSSNARNSFGSAPPYMKLSLMKKSSLAMSFMSRRTWVQSCWPVRRICLVLRSRIRDQPLPKGDVHQQKERVQDVKCSTSCRTKVVPGVVFIDESPMAPTVFSSQTMLVDFLHR